MIASCTAEPALLRVSLVVRDGGGAVAVWRAILRFRTIASAASM
jgi:hypothetical protein